MIATECYLYDLSPSSPLFYLVAERSATGDWDQEIRVGDVKVPENIVERVVLSDVD